MPSCRLIRHLRRPFPVSWLLLAAWSCLGGCRPADGTSERFGVSPASATPVPLIKENPSLVFTEVTSDAGVNFTYRNGQEADHCAILESLGGGVGIVDYDRDGWMDLGFPGGGDFQGTSILGRPTGLFRNAGGLRWQPVSAASCLDTAGKYTHGIAAGDYDNDGFPDLLVTGYGGVVLWKNQGDGTFRDETPAAGLDAKQWSSSAGWGDLNGDGNLDLYVTNYVNWSFANHPDCSVAPSMREICSPKEFQPLADEIYFNQGDGTFRNASEEAGLRKDGKGLGVMLADLDNDRDLDIYVANDTTPNFFYLNDGHGRMEEVGMLRGVALDDQGFSNGSMGVELCDYNSDGLYDIWVANYEDETFALYRNEGRGFFLHVSQSTGVTALGQLFVGFGTQCADFDRDGDEDIVVSNGHVIKYSRGAPRRQLPLYLENRGKRFARVNFPTDSYFAAGHEGRGIVGGDLDNDGDWDLVASNLNDPVAVLRNDVEANRWIGVQLSGTHSNRDAIGTHLTLETTAGNWVRQLRGGGSYLSTSDPRLYWGVPRGVEVRRLIVQWPNGQQQVLESPPLERFIRVIQPRLPPGQ